MRACVSCVCNSGKVFFSSLYVTGDNTTSFLLLLSIRDRVRTRNEPGVYRSFKLAWVGLIYDRTSSNFGFITTRVSLEILYWVRLKVFLARCALYKDKISHFQTSAKAFWIRSKRTFPFKCVTRTWFFIPS